MQKQVLQLSFAIPRTNTISVLQDVSIGTHIDQNHRTTSKVMNFDI